MIDPATLTIAQAHKSLVTGEFTVQDLVDACKKNITDKNGELNAFLEVFDDIDDDIARAQQMIDDGNATELTGIPISVKDNILIKGRISSSASKILSNHVAVYDATVITKLRKHGVIFVGRTNMDEFAMGSSTENSAYGPTKNPLDPTRVPGGSSGGAAASVAMGGCLAALGSDTAGSIRQPAAFCGVVGIYPTYGTVSRHGLMAMGNSLDQIGPIAKSVQGARIILDAIAGFDENEATSVPVDKRSELQKAKTDHPKVIGVPVDFVYADGVDPAIQAAFKETLATLESQGYTIKEISLPHIQYALATYYVLMPAEVSTNLSRFDGVRYGVRASDSNLDSLYTESRGQGFGPETRRRVMLGAYVLSAGYSDKYYKKAMAVKTIIGNEFQEVFESVGAIAMPATPTTAFTIGEISDPLSMYLADIFTVPANLTGLPTISVPCGADATGLPIGIQFMTPHCHENDLFTLGTAVENTL